MILFTFTSGESYYFSWSNTKKNLRIMLPIEETFNPNADEDEEEVPEEEKIRENKPELLKEYMRNGLLMNGNFEHDDDVMSIDVHCGLKIIASGDLSGLIKIWNYRR